MMPLAARIVALSAALAAASGCYPSTQVVRVVDGEQVAGRFVDETAYEAYLRASILEEEGDLPAAESAYAEASAADPEGPGPLVRLAAVRCAMGGAKVALADEDFERTARIAPTYAPLFVERARCSMARGRMEAADRDVRRAMELDPKDSDATILQARILERSGRGAAAVGLLHGYVTWRPQSAEVWRELREVAHRAGDRVREGLACEREMRTSWGDTKRRREPGVREFEQVDRLVMQGDLQGARSAALGAGIAAGELAVRMAALGRWSLALDQAATVLIADPTDANARAAAMALPDREQVERRLGARAWEQVVGVGDGARAGTLGVLLLADAVARRMGAEVVEGIVRAEAGHAEDDPLANALRARLLRR
ncbi:MAG TPA: hypothetical protein PLI95_08790 [Polyangiaceae bacterium]|nr:hypothetical protein [Polyangiaceae bacterium]